MTTPKTRIRAKLVPITLALLTLILGALTSWLYFKQYRLDRQSDPAVSQSALKAASDGTVALLSYSSETLDKDFAGARSHLSGDFLSYYIRFSQEVVAPEAKQKSVKTTAQVVGAAVSELLPNSAVVLVLVDQTTTSKDNPNPEVAASSVLVRMVRVDGNWLIAKFDAV
jgi:Mce-associated membrane protein